MKSKWEKITIEKTGPGKWDSLHSDAYNTSNEDFIHFIKFKDRIIKTLGCGECTSHFAEVEEKLPILSYIDKFFIVNGKKVEKGMFLWTVDAHNLVNKSLGKRMMSVVEAYLMYSSHSDKCGIINKDNLKLDSEECGELSNATLIRLIREAEKRNQ